MIDATDAVDGLKQVHAWSLDQLRPMTTPKALALCAGIWLIAVSTMTYIFNIGFVASILSITASSFLGYLLSKSDVDVMSLREFIDLGRPTETARDLRYVGLGIAAILAVELALGVVHLLLSPSSDVAAHSFAASASNGPSVVRITTMSVMAVFVGPFLEELIFRNGFQKLIAMHVHVGVAIGITSVLFALLHVPSYGGFSAPVATIALPLSIVFASSCIFGYVYHRTGNVLAAWFTHGGMNALALLVALT